VTGIVFAARAEAQPFLEMSGASPVTDVPMQLYAVAQPSLMIVVSGMGKVAAALATQCLMREHGIRRIVLGGACGVLSDDPLFASGGIFRVTRASEGAPGPGIPDTPTSCEPALWTQLPPATLVTLERPLFDNQRRQELAAYGELVDMEGAVVARTAAMYDVPCTIIKGVTDFAGDGHRRILRDNLAGVSLAVANTLWEGLQQHASSRFKA